MSLNSIRLTLPLGVLCFAAVALAQKPYNWVVNPPPVEVFALAFDKVWESSLEKEPFESLKGEYDPVHASWFAKVVLPGTTASTCLIQWKSVDEKGATITIKRHLEYSCRLTSSPAEKELAYSSASKLLQSFHPDWEISIYGNSLHMRPYTEKLTIIGATEFHPRSAALFSSDYADYVQITVYPATVAVEDPEAMKAVKAELDALFRPASKPSTIDSEITSVIESGRSSALPTPQASQSGTSGRTALAITNGYKIVGRVSASSVLPFYGTETYAGGSVYNYRFYLK